MQNLNTFLTLVRCFPLKDNLSIRMKKKGIESRLIFDDKLFSAKLAFDDKIR